MPIEKHDLIHEFPEHKEIIHQLKISNNHFAKLFDKYHQTDKEVHRIEDNIETPEDVYTKKVKTDRLALKDQLHTMILDAQIKDAF